MPSGGLKGAIMDRRRFEGSVVHEGDHFDYVVEYEANEYGMTWFATVFRGGRSVGIRTAYLTVSRSSIQI